MKRYLVFYGTVHYPQGGMRDFIGDFDKINDAIQSIDDKHGDNYDQEWDSRWACIYDSVLKKEIYSK